MLDSCNMKINLSVCLNYSFELPNILLMMTAEFMLSKRPVLRFTVALLFHLKLFSSHITGMYDCDE